LNSNQNPPTNKNSRPESFAGEFHQTSKEDLIPILSRIFQKIKEKGILPNSFYKASISLIPKPKTP